MSDMNSKIRRSLHTKLEEEGLELTDWVALPKNIDRMVRFRTLQEVLDEFDLHSSTEAAEEAITYVLQVRKMNTPTTTTSAQEPASDPIYLPNGKLNADYLLQNANILLEVKEYLAALQIYKTLAKAGLKTGEALAGIATCYAGIGKTDEALAAYENAITYNPDIKNYKNYAALLIQLNRHQLAAETIERALLARHLTTETRLQLHQDAARCWKEIKQYQKSEDHFLHALSIQSNEINAIQGLASVYIDAQRINDAKNILLNAIEEHSSSAQLYSQIAQCHLAEGDKASAYHYFYESLKFDLQQPKSVFHLVQIAYQIKNYGPACEILSQYIETSPFNAHLLYSLAGLQYHLGLRQDALMTLDKILSLKPNYQEAENLRDMILRSATRSY